jgi:hypothetical protein
MINDGIIIPELKGIIRISFDEKLKIQAIS